MGGGPNFQRSVEKALLGAIVITRYNNQTYRYLLVQCSRVSLSNNLFRVDEIDWDKTPSDEFDGRNGEKMSYQKYYAEKYNKAIRDPKQPLIITIPKVSIISSKLNYLRNLQLSHSDPRAEVRKHRPHLLGARALQHDWPQ